MSEPIDLAHLPRWSYWHQGIPDLLGSDHDLATRTLLGSLSPRHLRIDLAIEGVPVDPRQFARHLQRWCTDFMECRVRSVLSLVADALEGPCTEEELQAIARFVREQAIQPDILGRCAGQGEGS
jgi:hypothetical protein